MTNSFIPCDGCTIVYSTSLRAYSICRNLTEIGFGFGSLCIRFAKLTPVLQNRRHLFRGRFR